MIYSILLIAFFTSPLPISGMIRPPTDGSFNGDTIEQSNDIGFAYFLSLVDSGYTDLQELIDLPPFPEPAFVMGSEELSFFAKPQKCDLPKPSAHPKRKTVEKKLNFPCSQCEAAFESRTKFLNHFCEEHEYLPSSKRYSRNKEEASAVENIPQLIDEAPQKDDDSKPWRCTFGSCTKSFLSERNLQDHVAKHTGLKPLACMEPGCNARFNDKYTLGTHMKLHSPRSKISCPQLGCTKSYLTLHGLKKHFAKKHKPQKPSGS